MTDWAVVLEVATDGPGSTLRVLERLVEKLCAYKASALHDTDRYALHLVVDADGLPSALRLALVLHADAAGTLGMSGWRVVRTEAMTLAELGSSWDGEPSALSIEPAQRAWESSRPFAAKVQECERALLRCAGEDQLREVLAEFVRAVGGDVVRADDLQPSMLSADLSLGAGQPLFATAEPFSTSLLLLEDALPPLVEDARRIRTLLLRAALTPPATLDTTAGHAEERKAERPFTPRAASPACRRVGPRRAASRHRPGGTGGGHRG